MLFNSALYGSKTCSATNYGGLVIDLTIGVLERRSSGRALGMLILGFPINLTDAEKANAS